MQFPVLLLALAGMSASTPLAERSSTLSSAACKYVSFTIVNPLYGQWASGKYGAMYGSDEWQFSTNDSTKATTFTIASASGNLFGTSTARKAYWLGSVSGHDVDVRFDSDQAISKAQGSTIVTCTVPKANGDTLSCQADSSGKNGEWSMCYGNQGGGGNGLVAGNSTGPYAQPRAIPFSIFCGGVRAEVADFSCKSSFA